MKPLKSPQNIELNQYLDSIISLYFILMYVLNSLI
nr:MAG TPA: hypothetical protein [Caudoviricetes sp.]